MRFHNAGMYNGDENSLPQREHPEGYVPFKEAEDMKKFSKQVTIISLVLLVVMLVLFYARLIMWDIKHGNTSMSFEFSDILLTLAIFLLTLIPHEVLHAIWFKEDVYYYHNLKQGMLFVAGIEDMPKMKFILMSLCPNIIFGFIPFILYLIWPNLTVLGFVGVMAIASGAGDYLNVYHCATQVPSDGVTYMSGMHTYWYRPNGETK